MEKLQTLLRLSFLVVANIEVCPQGGLWLCRWCSECLPKLFTHIAGWQNRLFHLESKAVNREIGKKSELNEENNIGSLFIENFSDFAEKALLGNFHIAASHLDPKPNSF